MDVPLAVPGLRKDRVADTESALVQLEATVENVFGTEQDSQVVSAQNSIIAVG